MLESPPTNIVVVNVVDRNLVDSHGVSYVLTLFRKLNLS